MKTASATSMMTRKTLKSNKKKLPHRMTMVLISKILENLMSLLQQNNPVSLKLKSQKRKVSVTLMMTKQ